jgi:hypothetical protein
MKLAKKDDEKLSHDREKNDFFVVRRDEERLMQRFV